MGHSSARMEQSSFRKGLLWKAVSVAGFGTIPMTKEVRAVKEANRCRRGA
jgi:hypothetical protein